MMAALDVIVNWAHMAAGFTWVGGIIFVNIVLTPAVQPKGLPPEFVRIMGMERFRYVAWASIGVGMVLYALVMIWKFRGDSWMIIKA